MSGRRNGDGGGVPPSPDASGCGQGSSEIHRYPRNAHPDKAVLYVVGRGTVALKGQLPAFADALIAAVRRGSGVAAVEMTDAMVNPGDGVRRLRRKGISIDVQRGTPNRYVLRTPMQRQAAQP